MYRLLFSILIIFSIISAQTDGDVVKNVTAAQRTDGSRFVDITYDLEDDNGTYGSYSIHVTADWPGMYHNFPLTNCYGDIYENIIPGSNKEIVCQIGNDDDDYTQYLSGEYIVNVHADGHGVTELPDSFEMVEFSNDSSELIDYSFEMMKYEVTTTQYVDFLNDKLSQSISVSYNDHDGWPEQDGGETFFRSFTFTDDSTIDIWYSNPGGCQTMLDEHGGCHSYIPSDEKGRGYVYGYSDNMPGRPAEYNPHFWLELRDVTTIDNSMPFIQFTSNNICTLEDTDCSANNSFLISEGHGNHPIVNINFDGADAFADHYGLRLPNPIDYYIPFIGTYAASENFYFSDEHYESFHDGIFGQTANEEPYVGTFVNCEDWQNEYSLGDPWDCNTYPVGSGSAEINGISNLFGNVSEICPRNIDDLVYHYDEGIQLHDNHEMILIFGGSYEWVPESNIFADYENNEPTTGFRCVRTLAD